MTRPNLTQLAQLSPLVKMWPDITEIFKWGHPSKNISTADADDSYEYSFLFEDEDDDNNEEEAHSLT